MWNHGWRARKVRVEWIRAWEAVVGTHKAYHVNSHSQDRKTAITEHITKVRSGQKWRTWKGTKPVRLTRNKVPLNKSKGTTPPLLPRPSEIPIEKPTLPHPKVDIPTNYANEMGIHPFHQGNASKLQQDISGKKINLSAPDSGKNSQGKDSNTKDREK